MNAKQAKEKMKDFYLPTNWMQFYIFVRFPIGLIIDGIVLLNYLYDSLQLQLFDSLSGSLFVLLLSYYGFCVVVYRKMKHLEPAGYRYNQIFIGLSAAVYALGAVLNFEFTKYTYREAFWMWALVFAVIALIWWLPNYIYFKKRKELFGDADGIEKCAEPELAPKNEGAGEDNGARQKCFANVLWKCEACGSLNENSGKICSYCGNKRIQKQNFEAHDEVLSAEEQGKEKELFGDADSVTECTEFESAEE